MKRAFHLWLHNLFRLHHRDALRFATRLVGSRDDGEEVLQDAYVKIAARSASAPVEYPKTYLFAATRNAAVDFTMRRKREWSHRVDMDSLDEVHLVDDTVRLYEQRRQLAKLAVFLNELPHACRQAFIMNKLQGFSHPEISARLGISVSMVEKHMIRALLHCRNLMRDEHIH